MVERNTSKTDGGGGRIGRSSIGALFRMHKVARPNLSQLRYALPTRIGLAFYTQNTELLGVCPNILSTNGLQLEFVLPLLRRVQRASMCSASVVTGRSSCCGTSCESTSHRYKVEQDQDRPDAHRVNEDRCCAMKTESLCRFVCGCLFFL